MDSYDPFSRGRYPVGVRTFDVADAVREQDIPIEVWYPATEPHTGQDLDPATQDDYSLIPGFPATTQDAVRNAEPLADSYPAIVFSHGFAGHRRQTTHLCTHLASHGYVVAAPDHVGNTTSDVMSWMLTGQPPEDMDDYVRGCARDRTRDASRTLDGLLSGEFEVRAREGGAGISGHSFGGWTTIQTTAQDSRIAAALPLAPAGGVDTIAPPGDPRTVLSELVELSWGRHVPTMMIVAEDDSVLPLEGMHDLLQKADSIDRMIVLVNAGHYHFCDDAEMVHDMMSSLSGTGTARPSSELVPGAHAYEVTKVLGLAHFDAELRKLPEAAAFLSRDLSQTMAARDITIQIVTK